MSSSSAGKFQDHYALFGLDPKADSETIQKVYTKYSERYHPDNKDTGDKEKFDAVNLAFEVLSDPLLRREFDKLKGVSQDDGVVRFSGPTFFDALGRDLGLRTALLCVLYDRRRTRPFTPSLPMRSIENIVDATIEELGLALWYLKQRGLASNDDKSSLLITVEGMDYLEANRPSPDVVMPFIKGEAFVAPKTEEKIEEKLPEPAPARSETVMSVLNRARARG
jgi:hypothetical protein